jgi:hypothetical protein
MTLYIILFILGLLTGYVSRPMFTRHKHDYEVILHRKLTEIGIHNIRYTVTDHEKIRGFSIPVESVFVSCKKCKICNHMSLNVSNGTDRKFHPDWDFLSDKIKIILAKEREQKDQELLEKMNIRLAEKEVLTSPEVPYNPAHAKQTTPQ